MKCIEIEILNSFQQWSIHTHEALNEINSKQHVIQQFFFQYVKHIALARNDFDKHVFFQVS